MPKVIEPSIKNEKNLGFNATIRIIIKIKDFIMTYLLFYIWYTMLYLFLEAC